MRPESDFKMKSGLKEQIQLDNSKIIFSDGILSCCMVKTSKLPHQENDKSIFCPNR